MAQRVKKQQETCLLIGAGYTARALIPHLIARGLHVVATLRDMSKASELEKLGASVIVYQSGEPAALRKALKTAHFVISSVPPKDGRDPVICDLGQAFTRHAPKLKWAGYLSATSVYGDRQGQWAFEDEPLYPLTRRGRARIAAELDWLETGAPVHVFRLAGIYGPGRSPFRKIDARTARAVIKRAHIVNRIHVEDITTALLASMDAPNPAQVYNIADGNPAPPQDVLSYAADIMGAPRPPRVAHDTADISDMARSFYIETKAIDITRARKELGFAPLYPDYKAGLKAVFRAENRQADAVTLTGYIDVSGADIAAVREHLPDHIRATQEEPGCLHFSVTQDATMPNRYHVYERFKDIAAFDAHQSRARATPWAAAAKHVSRHYERFGLRENKTSHNS